MSLIWLDSFAYDDGSADAIINAKYDSSAFADIALAAGRDGSSPVFRPATNSAELVKTVPTLSRYICGGAFKPSSASNNAAMMRLNDLVGDQCTLTRHVGGQVSLSRGTTFTPPNVIEVTAGSVMKLGVWSWVEMDVTIGNSGAAYVVRVNGVTVLNSTGDTQEQTSADIDAVSWSGPGDWDCVYICDTVGSAPRNAMLGDFICSNLLPDGAGANTDFTPSAGSNFQAVDETVPDNDTTYVESSTNGHIDSYTFANVPSVTGGATPLGAQANIYARNNGGSSNCRNKTRLSATYYNGATTHATAGSYTFFHEIWGQNPDAGPGEWTDTTLNAAEFGFEKVA